LSWARAQDLIDALLRFPSPRGQRDVAGRHYLAKAEITARYLSPSRHPGPEQARAFLPYAAQVRRGS
jgi:hypothetical protein